MTLWTEEEIDYLERYCYEPEETIEEVAMFLGRTRNSVACKLQRMRKTNIVYAPHNLRPYSEDEVKIIARYYTTLPAENIAKMIRRPVKSVREKARQNGIRKKTDLKIYDTDIRNLTLKGFNSLEIARKLGIKDSQVRDYCYRNGIHFKRITDAERNRKRWKSMKY